MFEKKEYTVTGIDGDYAHLLEDGRQDAEDKLVARALLPEGIYEGCHLSYEMMTYRMEDNRG
ncbi:MAG: chorismate--pyruvate lyase [Lachnospiraceae bacterium]